MAYFKQLKTKYWQVQIRKYGVNLTELKKTFSNLILHHFVINCKFLNVSRIAYFYKILENEKKFSTNYMDLNTK
jgi:hypothetical protein